MSGGRGKRTRDPWLSKSREEQVREIEDCVKVLRETGATADYTTHFIAVVFTCLWPFRQRLAFAWKLVSKR